MPDPAKSYDVRRPWTAVAAGVLVGTLGGLIGLGGAEFRLPILITIFALLPHRAVRFNLLVSLITLAFAFATRLNVHSGAGIIPNMDVLVSMIAGGMIAAWVGAGMLSRIPPARLMSIIAQLLLVVAVMLVAEAAFSAGTPFELPHNPVVRSIAGVLAGLVVGAISSLLGVAGGEFIIPILIFLFGADIQTAGTLSLLISLPIVAIGVAKHRLNKHYRSRDVLVHLVVPMSLGSIIGAIMGGYLSAYAATGLLKIVLAAILAASAVKLWHKGHGP